MKQLTIYIMLAALLIACKKNDNYAEPDAGINVTVIDNMTNKPLESERPNGTIIKMIELKYPYCSTCGRWDMGPDGIWNNTKQFAGDYKVLPVEGPFLPTIDTQRVTLKSNTKAMLNFVITPYLNVIATATPTTGGVSISYTIARSTVAGKITESRTMVSNIPTVTTTVFDVINGSNKTTVRSHTAVIDETVLSTTYTDVYTGLETGRTYYIRAAARTASSVKYNYSPTLTIKVL
ncbi:MAG TPA: hypothetical protein VK541_11190 [Pedobacter sp.]|uniref:hypothetical protein n=1 Tax=Pedobacter sp. TaxID=1411316 RepID=UPI002BE0254E|nr:hypothetical protein [Pedobacter sp.]HMI03039.1 hypothetical protein [Pedobacter sp.]